MQVGRSLFMLWALRRHDGGNYRNFQRITVLARAVRLVLDRAAHSPTGKCGSRCGRSRSRIEYAAPACGFWTPGLGRSTTADWDVSGAHMAERCGLFIIIALGESILVTGATFGKMDWTAATVAAFAVAFIGSVAMWWIYFNIGAERAAEHDRGLRRSRPPCARRLHLHASSPGRRHHRHRGVGRTGAGASRRSHRFQDGGDDARRAGLVPDRQSDLQAAFSPAAAACRTWSDWGCSCLRRRRP